MKKLNNMIRVLPATLAVASILATLPVFAADSTATVVASRGTVSAVSNDSERTLGQGDSIFVNDRVVTGERSFAVLQFVDGAKVTVRPKSALVVEEYVYSGGDEDAATLSLVEGGLRVITGAMAKSKPENYKVKTPVALMGVRGTEFSVMLCGEEICAQDETESALAEN
jgi:hypothetical protein